MRFENKADLERELGCIEFFCNTFGLTYCKLGENDIDFSLHKNGELISYAEVKGRNRNIVDAYPLPIAIRKLVKLQDKKVNPVIIWDCYDGIIYGKTKDIYGMIYTGGRKPRENSVNDIEFMAYFTKQSKLIEKYF
jgi:hypothetical protein